MHRTAIVAVVAFLLTPGGARGVVIGPFSAVFPAPALNPPYLDGIAVQGFNPAWGTIRCAEVIVSQTWSLTGQFCIFALPGASGTVTVDIGSGASIGRQDGTGYTGIAGTNHAVSVSHSCAAGATPNQCCTPLSLNGGSSHRTLVVNPQGFNNFNGVPNTGFTINRAYSEQQTSPFVQGLFGGPQINTYTITGGITVWYHYTPVALCTGDVNGDGVIDFLDLNGVLGSYAETGPCARGDVNNDLVVDFLDLNAVLGFFGTACR